MSEEKHMRFDDVGRKAYDAYVKEVGGTTYDGKPIPKWEEIQPRQRNGWRAAAMAVFDAVA